MDSVKCVQLKASASGECSICFSDWSQGEDLLRHDGPNAHSFHKDCALEWISTRIQQSFIPNCGVCSARITHVNGVSMAMYIANLAERRRGDRVVKAAEQNSPELIQLLKCGEIDSESQRLAIEKEIVYLDFDDEEAKKRAFLNIKALLGTKMGFSQYWSMLASSCYYSYLLLEEADKNSKDISGFLLERVFEAKYREQAIANVLKYLNSNDWDTCRRALINIKLLSEDPLSDEFLSQTCKSSHSHIDGLTLLEIKMHFFGLLIVGDAEVNASLYGEWVNGEGIRSICSNHRKLAIEKALGYLDAPNWNECATALARIYTLFAMQGTDQNGEFSNWICKSKRTYIDGLALPDLVKNINGISLIGEVERNCLERVDAILSAGSSQIEQSYCALAFQKAISNLNSRDWDTCKNALAILLSLLKSCEVSEALLDMVCQNERSYIQGVALRDLPNRHLSISMLRAADENDYKEMRSLPLKDCSLDADTVHEAIRWQMHYVDSDDWSVFHRALRNLVLLLKNKKVSEECKELPLVSKREYVNGVLLWDLPEKIHGIEVIMAADKNDDYQLGTFLWGDEAPLSIEHRELAIDKALKHLNSESLVKCERALRIIKELLDSQEIPSKLQYQTLETLLTEDFPKRQEAHELIGSFFKNLRWTANLKPYSRAIAIFQAIKDGNRARVEALLSYGTITNDFWNRAFALAASLGRYELMHYFSQHGEINNIYRGKAIESLAMNRAMTNVITQFLRDASSAGNPNVGISTYYRSRAICQAVRSQCNENIQVLLSDGRIDVSFILRGIQLSIFNRDSKTLRELSVKLFMQSFSLRS